LRLNLMARNYFFSPAGNHMGSRQYAKTRRWHTLADQGTCRQGITRKAEVHNSMRRKVMGYLILIVVLSVVKLSAQGSQAQVVPTGPNPYMKSSTLTPVQQDGQRLFMQRCSICHTPAVPSGRHIGPSLSKDLFVGSDNAIRQIIMNGTDSMPGYRYGLSPSQIGSIIEYLKTGMEATEVDQSGPAPTKAK
jgi:mono/diheme cytochrome c family protein